MHERGVAVLGDDLGQHLALEDVGRAEAEVQALVVVVRELLGRVGRRELRHAGADDLVDDAGRVTLERGGADDGVDVLAESRRSTVWTAVSVVVSPESPAVSTTSGAVEAAGLVDLGDGQLRRRRSPVGRGRRGCRSRAAGCRS